MFLLVSVVIWLMVLMCVLGLFLLRGLSRVGLMVVNVFRVWM